MGKAKSYLVILPTFIKKNYNVHPNTDLNNSSNSRLQTCFFYNLFIFPQLLDCYEFVNYKEVSQYVFSTQDEVIGGIAKWVDHVPGKFTLVLTLHMLNI